MESLQAPWQLRVVSITSLMFHGHNLKHLIEYLGHKISPLISLDDFWQNKTNVDFPYLSYLCFILRQHKGIT